MPSIFAVATIFCLFQYFNGCNVLIFTEAVSEASGCTGRNKSTTFCHEQVDRRPLVSAKAAEDLAINALCLAQSSLSVSQGREQVCIYTYLQIMPLLVCIYVYKTKALHI